MSQLMKDMASIFVEYSLLIRGQRHLIDIILNVINKLILEMC